MHCYEPCTEGMSVVPAGADKYCKVRTEHFIKQHHMLNELICTLCIRIGISNANSDSVRNAPSLHLFSAIPHYFSTPESTVRSPWINALPSCKVRLMVKIDLLHNTIKLRIWFNFSSRICRIYYSIRTLKRCECKQLSDLSFSTFL